MSDNIFGLLRTIVDRIFQISESKRHADMKTFKKFVKIISPEAIQAIHKDLSGCRMKDWQLDIFQCIENHYASPANRYYDKKLQRKSEILQATFDKLSDFTSSHFTSSPFPGVYRIEKIKYIERETDFDEIERISKITEDLKNLSLAFGKAYLRFYDVGNRVKLSDSERVVILVVCILGIAFLVTVFNFVT